MRRIPLPLVLVALAALVPAIFLIAPHLAQAPRHAAPAAAKPAPIPTPCLSIQRASEDRLTTFLLNYQHDRAQALLTTNTACLKAVAEGPELINLLGTVNALRTAGERLRVELSGLTVDAVHREGGDIYTVTTTIGETRTELDAAGTQIGPTIRDQRQVIYRVRQVPGAPPGGGWLVQDESVQRRPQLSLKLEGPAAGVLAGVANQSTLQSLAGTATGTDLLHIVARQGFAVHRQTAIPDFFTDDGSGDSQPSGIYARNAAAAIPSYITLDSALHMYHLLQGRTLLVAETTVLPGRLRSFLHDALLATHGQEGRVPGVLARAAIARNGVYLAVAELLAGGTWPRGALSVGQMALAAREVNNISAHLATLQSPYLERNLDYTTFAPQGHYALDAGLSGYAEALRWLQIAAPALGPAPSQADTSTARRSSLQAVLLILAMRERGTHGTLLDQWEAIAGTIGSLIAPLPGPTLPVLDRSLTPIYGQGRAETAAADPELLSRAMALRADGLAVALFPGPVRPDDPLLARAPSAPSTAPDGMKLLPALASAGHSRAIPPPAAQGQGIGPGSGAPMGPPPSLYAEGLRLLGALTDPSPAGLPYLQREGLRRLRALGALGWWTELRQDSQPRAGLIDTPPPGSSAAASGMGGANYVDPRATSWRSLAALTADLRALIHDQHLFQHLPSADAAILVRAAGDLENILLHLATIAGDEQRGASVAPADAPYRRDAATLLGTVALRILHHGPKLLPLAGSQSAALATNSATAGAGVLFQAAEGLPQELWILVPLDGRPYLARGVIYSYYELPIEPPPIDDATWQAGGWDGRTLPGWTGSFEH